MRRTLTVGLGIAAALAATMLAWHRRGHEISGDSTPLREPVESVGTATRSNVATPIREAPPSQPLPRPPAATPLTAPTRTEPPTTSYAPSVVDRADRGVLAMWLEQDRTHTAPPRSYRGFRPAKPGTATQLMICDLGPVGPYSQCPAVTDLLARIADGADSTTGLWAANTENLLRDFFTEHGPFTLAQVVCSDIGCVVDATAPPLAEIDAADQDTAAKLRAETWYQQYFERGGGSWVFGGDETQNYEKVIVLKRRTTP